MNSLLSAPEVSSTHKALTPIWRPQDADIFTYSTDSTDPGILVGFAGHQCISISAEPGIDIFKVLGFGV